MFSHFFDYSPQKFPFALSIKIFSMTFKSSDLIRACLISRHLSLPASASFKPAFLHLFKYIMCSHVSMHCHVLVFLPRRLIPPASPAPPHLPYPFHLTPFNSLGFSLSVISSGRPLSMFQTRSGSPIVYSHNILLLRNTDCNRN